QDLICGYGGLGHGAQKMLRLLRAEAASHLVALHVAGGEIVQHDEGPDRCFRFLRRGAVERPGESEAELQLVIERVGIRGRGDERAARREGERVAHVIDRLTIIERRRPEGWKIAARKRLKS